MNSSDTGSSSLRAAQKCAGLTFPFKLYQMLEDVSEEGRDAAIVSWRPHGKAFTVHRQDDFVDGIMPAYFNQTRYKSFQRQLNLYGFVCIPRGEDKGAYFHKNFIRGERHLCHYIMRKKDQRPAPSATQEQMADAAAKINQAIISNKGSVDGIKGSPEALVALSAVGSSPAPQKEARCGRSTDPVSVSVNSDGSLSVALQEQLPSLRSRQQEAINLLDRRLSNSESPAAPIHTSSPNRVLSQASGSPQISLPVIQYMSQNMGGIQALLALGSLPGQPFSHPSLPTQNVHLNAASQNAVQSSSSNRFDSESSVNSLPAVASFAPGAGLVSASSTQSVPTNSKPLEPNNQMNQNSGNSGVHGSSSSSSSAPVKRNGSGETIALFGRKITSCSARQRNTSLDQGNTKWAPRPSFLSMSSPLECPSISIFDDDDSGAISRSGDSNATLSSGDDIPGRRVERNRRTSRHQGSSQLGETEFEDEMMSLFGNSQPSPQGDDDANKSNTQLPQEEDDQAANNIQRDNGCKPYAEQSAKDNNFAILGAFQVGQQSAFHYTGNPPSVDLPAYLKNENSRTKDDAEG